MTSLTKDYTFTVEAKPHAKQRPRLTRSGYAYTPHATRAAEQFIADSYAGPSFVGPIAVEVQYLPDRQVITIRDAGHGSKLRADVDNLLKTTLDGLTRAGAFSNDKSVVEVLGVKR